MYHNKISITDLPASNTATGAEKTALEACVLYHADMKEFEAFLTKYKNLQPIDVTEVIKKDILRLEAKFNLSYTRFKEEPVFTSIETYLKSELSKTYLKTELIKSDLIRNHYRRALFELNYLLNKPQEARVFAHEALIQPKHPSILQNFGLLITYYPIDEKTYDTIHTYLFNVTYTLLTYPLTKDLRSMIEEDFFYLNYDNNPALIDDLKASCTEEGMKDCIMVLVSYYLGERNFEKLRILIDTLMSHLQKSYQEMGNLVMIDCINWCVDNKSLDEMDKIFELESVKDKPLKLIEHQLYIAKLLIDTVKLSKESNSDNIVRIIQYLENPVKNNDLESSILMLRVILFYARPVLNDPNYTQKALKILESLEKIVAKMKQGEQKELRGHFYYTVGYIIENNLLPDSPKYKNDNKKVMDYYSKSAGLNYDKSIVAMSLMYQKTLTDLPVYFEKTEKCLLKGIALKSVECQILLADLKLSKMAICDDALTRKKLLKEGLDLIAPLSASSDKLTKKQKGDTYYLHAALLLALDTEIYRSPNTKNNRISFSFSINEIAAYSTNKTLENVTCVKNLLKLAADEGHHQGRLLLAVLGQYGTYFACDYPESAIHFHICYKKGIYSIEELVGSYLYMSARTTNPDEKGQYLKKAIAFYKLHLEKVKTPDEKAQLEDVFSRQVEANFPTIVASQPTNAHRHTFFISPQEGSIESRLMRAIKELNKRLSDNPNTKGLDEMALLQGLIKIDEILNASQADVPLYSTQLPALHQLLELLQNKFLNLSLANRIKLLRLCSQWPLVCTNNSKLYNMYLLTGPSLLTTLKDKVSVLLSMCRLKNKDGLLEDLLELHIRELSSIKIDSMDKKTVARLLYIFAIVHANTDKKELHALIQSLLETFAQMFQDTLQTYYGMKDVHSDKKTRTMVYNALVYLHFAYQGACSSLLNLDTHFISLCRKSLMTDDMVGSVSKSQQQIFDVLVTIDKKYQQEVLAGYRRVDFYNPNTQVVGFFHGPVHYLYDQQAEPLIVNPATTLCTKALELQKFIVFQISYLQLNEAPTRGAQRRLVSAALASVDKLKPRLYVTKNPAEIGNDKVGFWKKFRFKSPATLSKTAEVTFEKK